MGVSTGTRLDRLYALRSRINHEIAIEEQAALLLVRHEKPKPARRRRKDAGKPQKPNGVYVRLAELGVSGSLVKRWAYEQGLIAELKRGRCSGALVDAYEEALARGEAS